MSTILVLDDDSLVLRFVSKMLEARDHDVLPAATENECLDIVSGRDRIDLAIIDFWVGELPSLAILDAIEEKRPDLPVLVMSGGDGDVSLEILHSVSRLRGAREFLQKPFTKAELESKVDALLHLS